MQPLRVIVLVTAGPETGNRHEFDRKGRCLIGRADDCDILLGRKGAGFDISRHHCELEFDPPKLWLRDLGSRNGTYLNGHLIGCRPAGSPIEGIDLRQLAAFGVEDGDEIRVGGTTMWISFVGQPTDVDVPSTTPKYEDDADQPAGRGSNHAIIL